jgi:dipeptidyl-peptidase 4
MTQSLQHLFLHLSCGLRQRKRTVTGVALLLLGSAFPVLSPAQTTVDWQLVENASERALQPLYQENAVSPAWVGDSHYLFYDVKEASGRVVYLMNAATGKRERLIKDTDAFVRQYRTLLKDTSITADNLKLYSLRMRNGDARSVYWAKGGKHFVYHRPSGRLALTAEKMPPRFLTPASGAGQRSSSTRDSLFTMLGSRYDLYVRDNGSGAVTRLTHDGKEYASYCSRSAGDSLSAGNAAGLWYGHVYICLVTDDSKVGDLYLINALGKRRPSLRTRKMPLPNEPNVRQFRLFWYDADTRRSAFVPVSRFRDGVVDMSFGAVGNALYFTSRSRAADSLELCRLDLPTGTVRTVIREVCKPHLNLTLFNYHVVDKGRLRLVK